jgi:hypothetical protein
MYLEPGVGPTCTIWFHFRLNLGFEFDSTSITSETRSLSRLGYGIDLFYPHAFIDGVNGARRICRYPQVIYC